MADPSDLKKIISWDFTGRKHFQFSAKFSQNILSMKDILDIKLWWDRCSWSLTANPVMNIDQSEGSSHPSLCFRWAPWTTCFSAISCVQSWTFRAVMARFDHRARGPSTESSRSRVCRRPTPARGLASFVTCGAASGHRKRYPHQTFFNWYYSCAMSMPGVVVFPKVTKKGTTVSITHFLARVHMLLGFRWGWCSSLLQSSACSSPCWCDWLITAALSALTELKFKTSASRNFARRSSSSLMWVSW